MFNIQAEQLEENGDGNDFIDASCVPSGSFEELDSDSQRTVADGFLAIADSSIKQMNISRKNNETLFIGFKEGMQNKLEKMTKNMRESMKSMHEESTETFQLKLKEFMQVSKRVEMLAEDMKELTNQMEQRGNTREIVLRSQTFLEETNHEKEGIEAEVEEIISHLNKKRQEDEGMLMEFRESVHNQIQNSLKELKKSLELISMRNSTLMSEKCEELEIGLQHLSKFK